MLYISESKDGTKVIHLTRGDDAILEVPIENIDKEVYNLSEEEYLIFGVRQFPNQDSELLLNIESIPGSNRIIFRHEDTEKLEIGMYSAEIQLMTERNERITIWPKPLGRYRTNERLNRRNFIIMPEVVKT